MVPGACEASSPGANPILSTPLGVITVSKLEQGRGAAGCLESLYHSIYVRTVRPELLFRFSKVQLF